MAAKYIFYEAKQKPDSMKLLAHLKMPQQNTYFFKKYIR